MSYKQAARGNLTELRISFCAITPLNMCDKSKIRSGNRPDLRLCLHFMAWFY